MRRSLRLWIEDTLRVAGGDGYGSFGETFTYTFTDDGSIAGVRGESQVSLVPLSAFELPPVVTAVGRTLKNRGTPTAPG